jgi:hypothetical protein
LEVFQKDSGGLGIQRLLGNTLTLLRNCNFAVHKTHSIK